MNRRAAGVVFIGLATVVYIFRPTGLLFDSEALAVIIFLGLLGVFYLYLAETGKPRP